MINTKIIITETVENVSPYDMEVSLGDLQKKIQDWIIEYGPEAKLDWDANFWHSYDTQASPRFNIKRNREETDEEHDIRIKKEFEEREARRARDRAELERLKKVLGEK